MKIHRFIGGLEDSELDGLIASMNNPAILDTITRYGDMDHPSVLIKKMLHPSKIGAYVKGLWRICKSCSLNE